MGERYTDSVHAREGVATCYAIHLTGCNRVCLEWVDKDGDVKEMWVDETRLEGVELAARENGPGPDPKRRGIK